MATAGDRTHRVQAVSAWRGTLAGLAAILVGIGLARFAYTPLIPALVEAGWFGAADAAYLGAANLAGYLAGALLARRMTRLASPRAVLRSMMVLATLAFFACAVPLSFLWFFLWRFGSGLSGGALMVLAAATVLPELPPHRRGLASGIIFTGVGLGIAASGTLVPLLLRLGLAETWLGLGAVALLLTLLAWNGWPDRTPPRTPRQVTAAPAGLGLKTLYAEYALNAVGLVPHMVFLVDFAARGLALGLAAGAGCWVLFGLGATFGPMLAGFLGDRIGFHRALRLALMMQAAAVGLLAILPGAAALVVSSVVIGAFVPGVVPLVLGRIHELLPPEGDARSAAWSRATTAFALGQAAGAYGLSFLFAESGSYILLFWLAAGALMLALALDLAASKRRPHT